MQQQQQCASCTRFYTGTSCLACQRERRRKAKQKLSLSSAKRLKQVSDVAAEAPGAASDSSTGVLQAAAVVSAENATVHSVHDLSSTATATATAPAQDGEAAAPHSDQENAAQSASQHCTDPCSRELRSAAAMDSAACYNSGAALATERSPADCHDFTAPIINNTLETTGAAAENCAVIQISAQSCISSSSSTDTAAAAAAAAQLSEHHHDGADTDSEADEDAAYDGFENCSDGESYDGDNAVYCDDDCGDTGYYSDSHLVHGTADAAAAASAAVNAAAATDDSGAVPDVWVAEAEDCCIVCNSDISQLTLLDRELHVNACLDGSSTGVHTDTHTAELSCAICSTDLSEMTTKERHHHSNDCLDAAIREQASSARASAAAANKAAKQSATKQQQQQVQSAVVTQAAAATAAVHNTTDISAADYCCRLC
eukprot:10221-Heterococcus_DN1.PRE.2